MNRDMKFRFWLGQTGKMTYAHSLADVSKIIPEFTPDIISLQYTGLKDVNGIEIYEGDIVDRDCPEIGRIRRIIIFKNGSWRAAKSRSSSATLHNNVFAQKIYKANFTVIGNIYENTELIPVHRNNVKGVSRNKLPKPLPNPEGSDTTESK